MRVLALVVILLLHVFPMKQSCVERLIEKYVHFVSAMSKLFSNKRNRVFRMKSLSNSCLDNLTFALSVHESFSVGLDTSTSCLFYESILS